jgi:hypothetical protein
MPIDESELIPYQNGHDGAHRDPVDWRDHSYDNIVAAAAPVIIDWETGFDIRNVLGGDVKIKCQYASLSCVGQGWSYYIWVKQVIEMMGQYGMNLSQLRVAHSEEVDQISAKAIYSQIFIESTGGAYVRDGAVLAVGWGSVFEKIVPSLNPATNIAEESFMRDKAWKTATIDALAKMLCGLEFAVINACDNMDLFAQAIMQNHGVVGGVEGQNSRGWNTENPLAPIHGQPIWRHCLYYGAFGTDDKGRFIATPNSWGNAWQSPLRDWKPGDPPGDGWQKLRADYFNSIDQFNPWTYVDKPNKEPSMATNVKIIKDANSQACGIWLPAISPEALKSYCLNFGITVPKKPDGSIDWDKWIDGTLTLKKK